MQKKKAVPAGGTDHEGPGAALDALPLSGDTGEHESAAAADAGGPAVDWLLAIDAGSDAPPSPDDAPPQRDGAPLDAPPPPP